MFPFHYDEGDGRMVAHKQRQRDRRPSKQPVPLARLLINQPIPQEPSGLQPWFPIGL